jgi:DNA invertase Pin-like site-specific DNA recombinase
MKRVAIYLRVSTAKQDTANQFRELEAVAERSGWKVVRIQGGSAYRCVESGAS